jgi:hypothetical protein
MAEKLKSTLRTIPWFLPAKAAAFAAAWLWLPGWVFLLAALSLYLVPLFRPLSLAVPYIVLLFLMMITAPHAWAAIFFGFLFLLIVGIKDFLLIQRAPAYQALVYFLLFGVYLDFFIHTAHLGAADILPRSLWTALVFFLLARPIPEGEQRRVAGVALAAGTLLLWQWSWGLTFLPLNYFSQTALQFLAAMTFIEFLSEYGRGTLGRRKILTHFTIFFLCFAIVLAANSWRV